MIQQVIKTIRTLLPTTSSVTKQEIEQAVDFALMMPIYKELDRNYLIREVESLYNIRMDDFRIIEDEERRTPWIGNAKANIIWSFWNRYRDYLQIEKNYSDTVLNQIDKLTDRTLDGLFNPTEKIIVGKKGLVVGQVQSGKTSNYTGLICKAADAGYKLIIVLAGIHNNLRSQTQLRLDEGFLGFDTQHQRAYNENGVVIGVGKINQIGVAHSLTSSLDNGDFATRAADSMGGFSFNTAEPIIAVVKKNSKVLERLHTWLSAKAETLPDGTKKIRSKSLLLIDDEADNASINTNKDEDTATRINQHIKNILNLCERSGYVGYTATPFANIFIPIKEDDLFPRDFIINIPAPSNYIGPEKVFGIEVLEDDNDENDSVLPIVNRVDDYRDSIPNGHKKDDQFPTELPASLKTAIKCFILTCAIRKLRGQEKVHNSMLVHVSRYTRWQKQIKELVENTFNSYRLGIEFNSSSVLNELKKTFEEDHEYNISHAGETITERYKSYKTVSQIILDTMPNVDSQVCVHTWEEVLPHLHSATSKIEVREINGGSGDALNYFDHKDGLSVIAVGGDKLSRGLTLEGLSVSYYLRASRMYDTLMQMGRWFGYRPGYVDLCRLFTSRELNEWFCHITLASEELRSEFEYMSDVAGSTPEQYALRVRTHPGVLQISASNKIRRAVNVDISWAGRLVESYQLQKIPKIVQSNLETTRSVINSLPSSFATKDNHILWKNISAELVKPFFQNFKVSESLKKVDPLNLLRF
ncbi:MAG TPA: endonuclease, partial [Chitinophagaceae bacterium]|nr:endonuclease [Chitinophagaceae bacterium]